MILKILFLAISLFNGVFSIVWLNKLPMDKYSPKGNYLRLSIYSNYGGILDFIMFCILLLIVPSGEYDSAIGVIMFCLTFIVYGIPCVITSFRVNKRMRNYNNNAHNARRINGLNLTVLIKALFMLVEMIWLFET